MKSAIYIEDGTTQVVITPETEFEKRTLATLTGDDGISCHVFEGSFYDCRGGWIRQTAYHPNTSMYGTENNRDLSLILRAKKTPECE